MSYYKYHGKPKDKSVKEQILTNVHYAKTGQLRKKQTIKKRSYKPTIINANITLWSPKND